ncbi:MAG TPA: hypothetical protein ENJ98_00925 [Thiolapillus brandeum]|uniref:Uncharacterized protein n=1 Tax=Thiolapillus brandeum TaxID=1076588 RepID=A0A7C5MXB1_9GAMM|nr:hypothetical protein [Thiolapillus brandeum]
MALEINNFARLVLAWFWLVAWIVLAPGLGCAGVLLLLLPAVTLVAWNMLEPAVMRRRAFVTRYLLPGSLLSRWLSRHLLLSLWQILKSVVLVTVLLVTALQWPAWVLLLLLADTLLALGLYHLLLRLLRQEARPEVAGVLARRLLAWSNAGLLVAAVAAGELWTAHPDYRPLDWSGTLDEALSSVQVGCDLLAPLARAGAGQEAIAWRLMQLGMEGISSEYLGLAAWVIFLAASTLAIWAWSRLLSGSLIDARGLALLARGHDDG